MRETIENMITILNKMYAIADDDSHQLCVDMDRELGKLLVECLISEEK